LQTRGSEAPPLTPLEVRRAIDALPAAEWLRLHKVARALCRSTGSDPDDLLQEAFQRALDGSRQCPRDVDVIRFVAGVMRSIASDWSKARKRRPEISLVRPSGSLQAVVVQVRDVNANAYERLAIDQEEACLRQSLRDLFADDGVAQALLDGIMEGGTGEELRSLTALSETELASKRRLIRRRIDKAFPKEWKP
jgi:DNA-directed RNA polymerase specialized sigma24 family protein